MMRENESDGDGDGAWAQPPWQAGPRAPREAGHGAHGGDEPTLTHWQAAPPPPSPHQQQDYPDTVVFGSSAGQGSQPGNGSKAGHADQAGYRDQAGYGNQAGY